MYCKSCGKEIPDDATFCPHCGASITQVNPSQNAQPQTNENNFWASLSFAGIFLPIFGLICGFIGLSKANKLNGQGKGVATAGLIVSTVSFIISLIVITSML